MSRPLGCQITNIKVIIKITLASMVI